VNKIREGIGDKFANVLQWTAAFISGLIIGLAYGWKLALVIIAISPLLVVCGGLMTYVSNFWSLFDWMFLFLFILSDVLFFENFTCICLSCWCFWYCMVTVFDVPFICQVLLKLMLFLEIQNGCQIRTWARNELSIGFVIITGEV